MLPDESQRCCVQALSRLLQQLWRVRTLLRPMTQTDQDAEKDFGPILSVLEELEPLLFEFAKEQPLKPEEPEPPKLMGLSDFASSSEARRIASAATLLHRWAAAGEHSAPAEVLLAVGLVCGRAMREVLGPTAQPLDQEPRQAVPVGQGLSLLTCYLATAVRYALGADYGAIEAEHMQAIDQDVRVWNEYKARLDSLERRIARLEIAP